MDKMNKWGKSAGACLLALGFWMSASVLAQDGQSGELIDLSQRGPQVGDSIPQFSLPDQNGELWDQDSILGPNGAMLVFIRSADW